MPLKETRWWWIRHAPVIQTENRIYGQTDLPCDCTDSALFGALAKALPREAVLVTSDLQRAVQTAAAIAGAGLALPAAFWTRRCANSISATGKGRCARISSRAAAAISRGAG